MYRTIDCDTWDDPWFASLTPRGKFLFLYFITNRRTSAVGCFEITLRQIEFETGMERPQIDSALEELASRIVWWSDLQVIFVRNFYKHQAGNSNSDNFRKAAVKALVDFPDVVRKAVGDVYPDLMDPSVWDRYGIPMGSPRDGDNKTVTVTEKKQTTARARATTPNDPFEALTALCEATECDVGDLSEPVKKKQLGKAKQLLEAGMTVADIGRCAGYLASQDWRTSPIDMFTIEKERGKWELASKPAKETRRGAGDGRRADGYAAPA